MSMYGAVRFDRGTADACELERNLIDRRLQMAAANERRRLSHYPEPMARRLSVYCRAGRGPTFIPIFRSRRVIVT